MAASRRKDVFSSNVTAPAASEMEGAPNEKREGIPPPEEKVLTLRTSVLMGKVLICSIYDLSMASPPSFILLFTPGGMLTI